MKSRVSAGVNAVDDRLHGSLDVGAVVSQQDVDGLFIVPSRSFSVNHNLVVVSSLEDHMKDGLTELVLNQEVRVIESFEHFHNQMISTSSCQENWGS